MGPVSCYTLMVLRQIKLLQDITSQHSHQKRSGAHLLHGRSEIKVVNRTVRMPCSIGQPAIIPAATRFQVSLHIWPLRSELSRCNSRVHPTMSEHNTTSTMSRLFEVRLQSLSPSLCSSNNNIVQLVNGIIYHDNASFVPRARIMDSSLATEALLK